MTELVKDAEIAFVCPLYNKFAYGRRACLSFLKYTKRSGVVIAVDDASPFYPNQDWDAWRAGIPENRLVFKHFGENDGLTRSWNFGLTVAKNLGIKYCICSNSDVLFTPGWEEGLVYHLDHGYHMVGPVSNAPGVTNSRRQQVQNYFPGFKLTDDADYLKKVADYLRAKFSTNVIQGVLPINGFFMLAKTAVWWKGAFDETHVFNPAKKMAGNEDELQKRWHKQKWKTGFVPSSFIFHYRAVSRGDRFKDRGWLRLADVKKPV